MGVGDTHVGVGGMHVGAGDTRVGAGDRRVGAAGLRAPHPLTGDAPSVTGGFLTTQLVL